MESVVLNISKFSTHDGPGIRTVVFLKGCPLRCKWCHSPESWELAIQKYPNGEVIGKIMSVNEVITEVMKDKDFYDASDGGITISGGEPLFQSLFTLEILRKAKAKGLHTAIETSGYAKPHVIDSLLPYVDLWLWDIKELDEAKHKEYTNVELKPILDNLRKVNSYICENANDCREIILRCPMIPNLNDGDKEIEAIAKLANELYSVVEIDIEPYIPYGIDKAKALGLKVYEAPQPPPDYGSKVMERLKKFTKKPVCLP